MKTIDWGSEQFLKKFSDFEQKGVHRWLGLCEVQDCFYLYAFLLDQAETLLIRTKRTPETGEFLQRRLWAQFDLQRCHSEKRPDSLFTLENVGGSKLPVDDTFFFGPCQMSSTFQGEMRLSFSDFVCVSSQMTHAPALVDEHTAFFLGDGDAQKAQAMFCDSSYYARQMQAVISCFLCDREMQDLEQAVRMVVVELSRMEEHFQTFSNLFRELGDIVLFDDCLGLQHHCRLLCEGIHSILDRKSQGKLEKNAFKAAVYSWRANCYSMLEQIVRDFDGLKSETIGVKGLRERLDFGGLSAKEVLSWGISGPLLRSCGVNYDARKSRPLFFYDQLEFDVPVAMHGNPYDTFLVQTEEIGQSLNIILQILEGLPADGDFSFPFYNREQKELCFALENSRGEQNIFVSKGESCEAYVKSPSIFLMQAIPFILEGHSLDECKIWFSALNIKSEEIIDFTREQG